MEFYKDRPKISRIALDPYVSKRTGKSKPRAIHSQPGMSELLNIVAGLQKDVKRINKCFNNRRCQGIYKE